MGATSGIYPAITLSGTSPAHIDKMHVSVVVQVAKEQQTVLPHKVERTGAALMGMQMFLLSADLEVRWI